MGWLGSRDGRPFQEGFAGRYHIRYFHENGEFSDEYDLEIERTGDLYEATWLVDGEVSAVGVRMEVGDRLAIGWRRVDQISATAERAGALRFGPAWSDFSP